MFTGLFNFPALGCIIFNAQALKQAWILMLFWKEKAWWMFWQILDFLFSSLWRYDWKCKETAWKKGRRWRTGCYAAGKSLHRQRPKIVFLLIQAWVQSSHSQGRMVHKTTSLWWCFTGMRRLLQETRSVAWKHPHASLLTVPVTSLLKHSGPVTSLHTTVCISIRQNKSLWSRVTPF